MFRFNVVQRFWLYIRTHRVASVAIGHAVVIAILAGTWLSGSFASVIYGAFAQAPCAAGDRTYVVQAGDTLSLIGMRMGTDWQRLATHNHLANPNLIFINQHICIPGKSAPSTSGLAAVATAHMLTTIEAVHGFSNPFPYGQCTWWASQRYFQLSGVYVPWAMNANAYQWSARAREFNWRVSAQPVAGAILDLQPNIQGASGLGHVAVVERVYSNGRVLASSMNWGPNYSQVSNFVFSPGPGVTFIYAR
jgi:Surface antigen